MEIALSVLTLLAGIIVPIWLHRRAHPERQLRYRVYPTRILQHVPRGAGALTIQLEGQVVEDPHAVILELRSTGRADISTAAFDSGRSLVVDLGARILPGTVEVVRSEPTRVQLEQISDTRLAIHPQLLPKTVLLELRVITETGPSARIESPLIDVSVVNDAPHVPNGSGQAPAITRRAVRRPRITALHITNGLTVSVIVLFLAGVIIFAMDPERDPQNGGIVLSAVTLLAFGACLISYLIIGITRAVRLIRSAVISSRR